MRGALAIDRAESEIERVYRAHGERLRQAVLGYSGDRDLVSEIARIIGSTTAAVDVHLSRGRRRLRELLGERGVEA